MQYRLLVDIVQQVTPTLDRFDDEYLIEAL
jgi:hypothetical protein